MQRSVSVLRTFLRLGAAKKVQFGTAVLGSLNGVPGLPHTIAQLRATNAALASTAAAAEGGAYAAIAARNAAEKAWDLQFGEVAKAVNAWAAGDEAKILQAGFAPSKSETAPTSLPVRPTGLKVTSGAGAAAVEVEKEGKVDAFIYVAAPQDATVRMVGETIQVTIGGKTVCIHADTHRTAHLQGLDAGAKMQVVVQAINAAGSSPVSDPTPVIAQG